MQSQRLVSALIASCQPGKGFSLLPMITKSIVPFHLRYVSSDPRVDADLQSQHPHKYITQFRSKRKMRKKAKNEKSRLEDELQYKYGIERNPQRDPKEWMRKFYGKELAAFTVRLGLPFVDNKILRSSFMHRSFVEELDLTNEEYITEDDVTMQHRFDLFRQCDTNFIQETLSLVGYNTTVSCLKAGLYERYRNLTPNVCEAVCNFLMGRKTINDLAKWLDITEYILVSAELEGLNMDKDLNVPFSTEDITSDTFFAFIGSIVLSCGEEVAQKFIRDVLLTLIDYTDLSENVAMNLKEARDELTELLLLNGITSKPEERITFQGGLASDLPLYFVGIFVNGLPVGEGAGLDLEGRLELIQGRHDESTAGAKAHAYQNAIFTCLEEQVDFKDIKDIEDSLPEDILLEGSSDVQNKKVDSM